MKLKLAFFGTPDFSARFLEKLLNEKKIPIDIKLVATQQNKPVGMKKISQPTPTKQIATTYNIPCYDGDIKKIAPALLSSLDLVIVYFYGQIIPAELLNIPKFGFWNIHFSLLPKYRGPTPATFSLILGDTQTAISLVLTDAKLDHGPLITQDIVDIYPHEKRIELEERLHKISYDILIREMQQIETINKRVREQDHTRATYTRFSTRNDGFIPLPLLKKALRNEPLVFDELPEIIKNYYQQNNKTISTNFNQLQLVSSAKIVYDYFRGLYPWPGIWTLIEPPRLKGQTKKPRGLNTETKKRLKITDLSLVLHTTYYKLHIARVQLEGKKEVDFEQFNRLYSIL